mgnify:CR=1 FL=1
MSALVYFSSASGNTTRFVEGCRLDEFGIHTMRIPLRRTSRSCMWMSLRLADTHIRRRNNRQSSARASQTIPQ